jgi:prevent-host-death family protein
MTERQIRGDMIGIAEAKRRFRELVDRVQSGERFVVSRRGKPAIALVPPGPELVRGPSPAPRGLAAGAGALGDWDGLPELVEELYAARGSARDRPVPDFD